MRRRGFLKGFAAIAAVHSSRAFAQRAAKRMAFVYTGTREANVAMKGLLKGFADHGYIVGRDLNVDEGYADGRQERLPALIVELLARNPDVLVTAGASAAAAARTATSSVPIVSVSGDPVGEGVAANLAHPGGNLTGLSLMTPDFVAKWLDLMKAIAPGVRRFALLYDPAGATSQAEAQRLDLAAPRLGVTIARLSGLPSDFESSLAALSPGVFDAFLVADSPLLEFRLPELIARAAAVRLPALYGFSTAVPQGGLMSYSPDFFELWRRASSYVDRILKGAHPADLPIEQATQLKFAVNLKTARVLGLEIPPTLLAAANEVVE